jgi:hypothetical protein
MLLLLTTLAHAAPVCPATATELDATAAEAESAFAQMDAAALAGALSDALAEVACMREPIPPVVAARVHRARALAAFVDGNDTEARRALYAAHVLDPAGDLPASAAPPDHPIRELLPRATTSPSTATVPAPSSGYTVYFDGSATLSRPSDRPTVFQLGNARGEVVQGQYLPPEAVMPPYARGTAEVSGVSAARPDRAAERSAAPMRASLPLAVVGGTALVAGGVTYALATAARADFDDPTTPLDELDALRDRTNSLVHVSGGLAGLGVACGLSAVVVGRW